ncbi:MAG: aminotransferase class I/II-fold pyridoxal phosphate-dependent enzyme [Cytophagales bacterium]|nr:aminotransferase class I/II-fold pyridoxal phosphate-dependent enzyme [Cytophagales bacterium]
MSFYIPLSYNSINSEALAQVLHKFEGRHHQEIIASLEANLAHQLKVNHVVAVNSGTAAIHLALQAIGVQPHNYVLAPTFTYVATVNPVLYLQARPVLIDCEDKTWNLDPNLLETALRDLKSKGIRPSCLIVVHTYGTPALLDDILTLASKYEVPVVEDAAEALGATLNKKPVGTYGRVGVYSFNNNKAVTSFGGGAVVTNDGLLASRVRFLAAQARKNAPFYLHEEPGFNYSINPLAAAYLLSQLTDLKNITDARRTVFQNYCNGLKNAGLIFQEEREGAFSARWLSTFLTKSEVVKSRLEESLQKAGIETRPLWNPMHEQPLYRDAISFQNGNARQFFNTGICLPSGNTLSQESQSKVIEVVSRVLM